VCERSSESYRRERSSVGSGGRKMPLRGRSVAAYEEPLTEEDEHRSAEGSGGSTVGGRPNDAADDEEAEDDVCGTEDELDTEDGVDDAWCVNGSAEESDGSEGAPLLDDSDGGRGNDKLGVAEELEVGYAEAVDE